MRQHTDDRPAVGAGDDDELWVQVSCSHPDPNAPTWWVAVGRGENDVVVLSRGLTEAQAQQLRDRVAAILRVR